MKNDQKNNQKTQVYNLIILDKSGSMCSIADAAIAGFNETVGGIRAAQKQFTETQQHYVSLLTFCSCTKEYVYNCVPVDQVKNLTSRNYEPCCGTPLYDAMGMGINDLLKKTKKMENASVVVTVITDGMENSSTEYSGEAIKALVDKMTQERGWNFAYIGTNQDVESVAINLSITNTMFFEDSEEGMNQAWERERKSKRRMFSRMDSVYCCACAEPGERMEMVHESLRSNKNYQSMEDFAHRVTPAHITTLKDNQIFVFGSNKQGEHNGGAAAQALKHFGAVNGQAKGPQGQSYAIISTEGAEVIYDQVGELVSYAKQHPELTFLVTAVGCGVAGLGADEVAPMFIKAIDVENIWLPQSFWDVLV